MRIGTKHRLMKKETHPHEPLILPLLMYKSTKQSKKLMQQRVQELESKHLQEQKICGQRLLRYVSKITVYFAIRGANQRKIAIICSGFFFIPNLSYVMSLTFVGLHRNETYLKNIIILPNVYNRQKRRSSMRKLGKNLPKVDLCPH